MKFSNQNLSSKAKKTIAKGLEQGMSNPSKGDPNPKSSNVPLPMHKMGRHLSKHSLPKR